MRARMTQIRENIPDMELSGWRSLTRRGPDIIYLHYDYQIRLIVIVYTVNKRSTSNLTVTGLYFPGLRFICTQMKINGT